jgi:hypothetical protein
VGTLITEDKKGNKICKEKSLVEKAKEEAE